MESIIQKEKKCFVCRAAYGLHRHHVFGGTGRRKISEDNGFTVWLCGFHHNMSSAGVHFNRELDLLIKRAVQEKYEEAHSREEFIRLAGKSWI